MNKSGSCCTPEADHSHRETAPKSTALYSADRFASAEADAARPMMSLSGGSFLMGTDYSAGFPADGEGPVREVVLSPFAIDVFPVTNQDFA